MRLPLSSGGGGGGGRGCSAAAAAAAGPVLAARPHQRTLPVSVQTTPASGDILIRNAVKLPPSIPVLRRVEPLGEMYDYKPSLVALNNTELLIALRHQNGSLAALHAVFLRSLDGGLSWRRETPLASSATGPAPIGGGEFSLHTAPDGSVLLLSGCLAWRSTDGGRTFPHNMLLNWPDFKPPFGHCHSSMAWSVVTIVDDDPVVSTIGGLPPGLYFFADSAIFRSTDSGVTSTLWTMVLNDHWQLNNPQGEKVCPACDNEFFGQSTVYRARNGIIRAMPRVGVNQAWDETDGSQARFPSAVYNALSPSTPYACND
jgi:hypothetical protein